MSINNNVCRLCLGTDNLLWVFGEVNGNMKMNDVVYFATGIRIQMEDVISQQICNKCYQFTIKMFQFRGQCVKSEKYLKEQWRTHFKNKKINSPRTQVAIKSEPQVTNKPSKPSYCIHPSVAQMAKTYPDIKLPLLCLKSHIAPEVVMELDEVESYFKKKNLDINVYIKAAMNATRKTNRLIKLEESNVNTEEKTVIGTQQPKDNSVIEFNKGTKVVNTKKSVKSSRIKPCFKKKKRFFAMKGLIRTPEINNIMVKSKRHAISVNTNRSVKINSVKQCPKRNVNISEDNGCSAKFPLLKGQLVTSENRKRKLSEMSTKINTKQRSRLLDVTSKTVKHSVNVNNLSESLSEVQDATVPTELLNLSSSSNNFLECLSYIDKSVPLHICTICNSVQYSAKRLRRHRIDHFRCQFCNVRFRNLQGKIDHTENRCIIKKAMTNMPDIEVERIEYNIEMRRKYPEAFVNFPPVETENGIDLINCDDVQLLKLDITEKFKTILKNMPNCSSSSKQTVTGINSMPEHLLDVIEILSDEEESSNTSSRNHMEEIQNPTESFTNQLLICQDDMQRCPLLLSPHIKIKNHSLLNKVDFMDSDVDIMKKLLILSQTTHAVSQKHTQTLIPSNKDIIKLERNVVLKDLRRQLWTYKIPVKTRFGKLRVSYDYNTSSKQYSKLCFWNDLTPIDIKQREDQNYPTVSDETSNTLDTIQLHTNSNSPTSLSVSQSYTGSTMNDSLQPPGESNALSILNMFPENANLDDNDASIGTNEYIHILD